MSNSTNPHPEKLWQEYAEVFQEMDDLSLGRWMAQTLGQFRGKALRLSHPLVNTYRVAAQFGHQRQIWLQRLASAPASYTQSPCCRAPFLPILSRDVLEAGLVCLHCSATAFKLDEMDASLADPIRKWAEEYAAIHAVAHWEQPQRGTPTEYESAFEEAAEKAESLLAELRRDILPSWLEHYAAIVWEDQDECLDVTPEDIET